MADSSLRRSTRQAGKAKADVPTAITTTTTTHQRAKAKPNGDSSSTSALPTMQLEHILKNPKSLLASMDMAKLINEQTWEMLSPDSQTYLAALLPPTALHNFRPFIEADHPSRMITDSHPSENNIGSSTADDQTLETTSMDVDPLPRVSPAIFTSPHLLAAMHTYQDHLYSGWLTEAHATSLQKFRDGVLSGTLGVNWKDEDWIASEGLTEDDDSKNIIKAEKPSTSTPGKTCSLVDLARNNAIKTGDIFAYRRRWGDIVVEKDVIIHSASPLTVLIVPGSSSALPRYLTMPAPIEYTPPIQAAVIMDAVSLERAVVHAFDANINMPNNSADMSTLKTTGKAQAGADDEGLACKAIAVWRWRDEAAAFQALDSDNRVGRENHGTLFYLRGSG